ATDLVPFAHHRCVLAHHVEVAVLPADEAVVEPGELGGQVVDLLDANRAAGKVDSGPCHAGSPGTTGDTHTGMRPEREVDDDRPRAVNLGHLIGVGEVPHPERVDVQPPNPAAIARDHRDARAAVGVP